MLGETVKVRKNAALEKYLGVDVGIIMKDAVVDDALYRGVGGSRHEEMSARR